jgi:hypothetical protein
MSEKEDDIGLIDVLLKIKNTIHFLLLRKWFIISSAAILGVLGLIISFLYPTKYESKLTFIVEQTNESASLGALGGLASSFGFGGLAGDNGLYKNKVNLINYMNSRSLIEKSLLSEIPGTSQTFADRFLNVYQWRSDWNDDLDLKKIRFLPEQNRDDFDLKKDSVLFEIYNFTIEEKLLKISVPDEEGSIIAVNYKSIDDTLSRYFPEALLGFVSESYINTKTKLSRDNVEILQHQTDSVRRKLEDALYNSAYQTDEVFGLNPALNVKRVPASKQQIDVRASTVLLEELIKNLELAKVQLKDITPLIEVIDSPRLPLKEYKIKKSLSFIIGSLLGGTLSIFYLLFGRILNRLKTT